MALAVVTLDSGSTDVDGTSVLTNSKTPTANALQLLAVARRPSSGGVPALTVTGCGLTWVAVRTDGFVTVFRALGASPSTEQLTISSGATTCICFIWSWVELTGCDTSGTNGSGAIVQSNGLSAGGSSTSIATTLSARSSADNLLYEATGIRANAAITNPTSWTEIHDLGTSTDTQRLETAWYNADDLAPTSTFSSSSNRNITALEVKARPVEAELASATGTANTPSVGVSPSAGTAAATGTANAPTSGVSPSAGHAAATGTASTPSISIKPAAGHAAATATAYDATVSTTDPTFVIGIDLSANPPTEAPDWQSITNDVRVVQGVTIRRGRAVESNRFETGTCDLTLNNRERTYDPEFDSSIKPNLRLRVTGTYQDDYILFDGYVDGFEQDYPHYGKDAIANVSSADGFKVFAQADLEGLSPWDVTVAALAGVKVWLKFDETIGVYDSKQLAYIGAFSRTATGAESLIEADASGGAWEVVPPNYALCYPSTGLFASGTVQAFGFAYSSTLSAGVIFFGYDAGSFAAYLVAGKLRIYSSLMAGYIESTTVLHDGNPHYVTFSCTNVPAATLTVDGVATTTITAAAAPFFIPPLPTRYAVLGAGFSGHLDEVIFGAAPTYAQTVNPWVSDETGTRVARYLDHVGWLDRDLDTGNSTVIAYDFPSGSLLDALQTLAETEQGQFYMGLDGDMSSADHFKAVWRGRHATITATRSNTSQATFGDGPGELPYAALITDYSERRIWNDAQVTRANGVKQQSANLDSQSEYFRRTYTKSGLLYENDNEAKAHADWIVDRYGNPEYRIVGLVVKPQRTSGEPNASELWPQVLGREIGDRITVIRRPMDIGDPIEKELIIEGVEHSYRNAEWITTWRLSEADTRNYWILGDATYGVLGTTTRLAF